MPTSGNVSAWFGFDMCFVDAQLSEAAVEFEKAVLLSGNHSFFVAVFVVHSMSVCARYRRCFWQKLDGLTAILFAFARLRYEIHNM